MKDNETLGSAPMNTGNNGITLIWFTDKGGTKRIRVSAYALMGCLLGLAGTVIIGLGAFAYLFVVLDENGDLQTRLRQMKSHLFTMQDRYENVIEVAYEEKGAVSKATSSDQAPASKVQAKATPDETTSPPPEPATPELAAKSGVGELEVFADPKTSSLAPAETQQWQVEILNIDKKVDQQRHLAVKYRVANRDKGQRSSGFVWAVLAYRLSDGRLRFASAPFADLVESQSGRIRSHKLGDRFYIRRFRDDTFHFELPSQAKLAWVKVEVSDLQGRLDTRVIKDWRGQDAGQKETDQRAASLY
jgi:hypothetical protein